MSHMDLMSDRPIKQLAESPARTHLLCIPVYNYARLISPVLLAHCSPVYEAFLRHHNRSSTFRCTHCALEHNSLRFCFPAIHTPYELDFLMDFLELTPQAVFSLSRFLSFLRLCDFLLLPNVLVYDLIQLYVPPHMRNRNVYIEALVEVLGSTTYRELGGAFAITYFPDSTS